MGQAASMGSLLLCGGRVMKLRVVAGVVKRGAHRMELVIVLRAR
jgi:hypothetical protein